MAEFLKPQSPLQHGNGSYIYPLTTVDQVIMDDGRRLNAKLEDLDAGVQIVTLWENVRHGDDFLAQTVPISYSEYEYICIICEVSPADYRQGQSMPCVIIPAVTGASAAISSNSSDGSAIWGHCRVATLVADGVQFGNGHQYSIVTNASTLYLDWNNRAIPIMIFGIKGVS